jgi:hypothetical protein
VLPQQGSTSPIRLSAPCLTDGNARGLLPQPGGFEGLPSKPECVQGTLRGQMILNPDESSVPQPVGLVEVPFQPHTACASLCPNAAMKEDAPATTEVDRVRVWK